jgi:serine protease
LLKRLKKRLSAKLPALALIMASYTVSANIDYHRLVWDADPAHQAVIGFSQSNSSEIATVKYGYSTDESTWIQKSVSNSQNFDGTNFTSSFVRLTGLTENSAVYYRVCEGNSCGERLWFKTAATDNSAFVMLAGGDTRTGWSTRKLGHQLLAKIRPLFIMHGGDFTSANNASQMKEFFKDWQLTFSNDNINGIAYKRIYPLVPTHGNHENGDYKTLCRVFGVDYNADGVCSSDDTYGAFNISPLLRIYTLNSEYQRSGWSTQAAAQANWLTRDLGDNSSNVSWRFAQYHKPFYPHISSKDENPALFAWWANEFYNNAMNLVFESDTHLAKITHAVIPVGDTFQVTTSGGTVYAGEGSWGAPVRSTNKSYPWTIDAQSIQQFKIITVSNDAVEIRTAQFDPGASTISAQQRANNATVLPTGVNWWSANGIGEVMTLTRNDEGLSIVDTSNVTLPEPEPEPGPSNDDMILDVIADTFISQTLANQNFNASADQLLAHGQDPTYGAMQILLAWDVSAMQSCDRVTGASIQMEIIDASNGTYDIYSSVSHWNENEVTWSTMASTENQGSLMASFQPETTGSHEVSFAAEGLNIVQNWIADSNNNHGLIITSQSTNKGIDVEDREQGIAAKLRLTLDNSACVESPEPDVPNTPNVAKSSEFNNSGGGSMHYFYLLVCFVILIRKVNVNST